MAKTLIHNLVDIAAKGGNYLLNVGPTAAGVIPPESVERLAEMGVWLRQNGEAIYGTQSRKRYKEGAAVWYTLSRDGKTTYAILTENPGPSLTLKQVALAPAARVQLLGADGDLKWRAGQEGITVSLPAKLPGKYAWVVKMSNP